MNEPRTYPLPAPDDDPRFTFGLTLDVADALATHGYPEITSGPDFVDLQEALFRFLYAPPSPPEGVVERPCAGGDDSSREACAVGRPERSGAGEADAVATVRSMFTVAGEPAGEPSLGGEVA